MSIPSETPYSQFSFLLHLDGGGQGARAGFSEVSGLDTEIAAIQYRGGNTPSFDAARHTAAQAPGSPTVTLKRGLMDAREHHDWLERSRSGAVMRRRLVTISLFDEDRSTPVQTWKLRNAYPLRHVSVPPEPGGDDVAIEELVLSCEGITAE